MLILWDISTPHMLQVTRGISEFVPSPIENKKAIESQYRVRNTLLVTTCISIILCSGKCFVSLYMWMILEQVKYSVDAIDESDGIEDALKPRIQELDGRLEKIAINGNHITPCVQVNSFNIQIEKLK
jgi:hypothetical protein